MTNPNALPFDADSWPEKQRAGWRFAVSGFEQDKLYERPFIGMSPEGKPVWWFGGAPVVQRDDLCYMLPPPRVLTFSLGLFKRDGSAWVGFTTTESDRFLVRDLTPAEMAEGRVALDD